MAADGTGKDSNQPQPSSSASLWSHANVAHWGGFLVSGLVALSVDAAVLEAGVRLVGLTPLQARIVAIALAMVAGWLCHRRLTFNVTAPPTLREFVRYAASASSAAILNYGLFALALWLVRDLSPLAALVIASCGAMIFSYLSMKYAVFRNSDSA